MGLCREASEGLEMSLRNLAVTVAALCALCPFAARGADAKPATEASGRMLVLQYGKNSADLKSIVERLCREIQSKGPLANRYTDVVIRGKSLELADSAAPTAPSDNGDLVRDYVNMVEGKSHDLTSCTRNYKSSRFKEPADILSLNITARLATGMIIQLQGFEGDSRTTTLPASAYGVTLGSQKEVEDFVACIGLAAWKLEDWVKPGNECKWFDPPLTTARQHQSASMSSSAQRTPDTGIGANASPIAPATSPAKMRSAPLWLAGAGVVTTIAGSYFGVRAFQKHSDGTDWNSQAWVANVGFGVGAAALATALYLEMKPRSVGHASVVGVTEQVAYGAAALEIGGRW